MANVVQLYNLLWKTHRVHNTYSMKHSTRFPSHITSRHAVELYQRLFNSHSFLILLVKSSFLGMTSICHPIQHRIQIKVPTATIVAPWFRYMCIYLFNYIPRSRNSWSANNDSKVRPCYELQELNHLDNKVTSSNKCILVCRY